MKITVVTPTIRNESLELNESCLDRQTLKDFEWIVVSPYKYKNAKWIPEPRHKADDFYGLNKAWNEAFRNAAGDLIVSIVDLLWFPPTTLEVLWRQYVHDPQSCVGLIGHQYKEIVNGKPETKVWSDPRYKEGQSFFQIPPTDLELCVASLPLKGIKDVGGVDEEFDKFPAWSEKELCCRIEKLGYRFFIDQSIEYRALYHPRLNEKWDAMYPSSTEYFTQCYSKIQNNTRLKLDFV